MSDASRTSPPPLLDRILGCLLGGAIGDSLGAPVERMSLEDIRRRHAPEGLTDRGVGWGETRAITANTQLTLFTAQALVQASVRAREKGIGGAVLGLLQSAYLTWLSGQDGRPPAPGPVFGSWLTQDPAMTARRNPGRSCLSALHKAAARRKPGHPLGTPQEPINDSKGCAGVVRAAPCGFNVSSAENAFQLGCGAAALTHGHPSGHLPAGVLAATVWGLLHGMEFEAALAEARRELRRHEGHKETSAALKAAVELARQGPSTPERVETLGTGWTGEQALAIAVYVVLRAEDDVPEQQWNAWKRPVLMAGHALLRAAGHSGCSSATAAITGSLLGARHGSAVFPGHWQAELEVRRTVLQMAADCALEFGVDPPTQPDGYGTPCREWLSRYPEA